MLAAGGNTVVSSNSRFTARTSFAGAKLAANDVL